jgi:hypothetical protein
VDSGVALLMNTIFRFCRQRPPPREALAVGPRLGGEVDFLLASVIVAASIRTRALLPASTHLSGWLLEWRSTSAMVISFQAGKAVDFPNVMP